MYSNLYWLTRLDSIHGFLIGMVVISFIVAVSIIVGCLISADFDDFKSDEEIEKRKELRNQWTRKLKLIIPLGFIFWIILTFLPSKNDVIFIVAGGKTLNWIKQDTSINKIPSQTTAIISNFLQKEIDKFNPDEHEKQ